MSHQYVARISPASKRLIHVHRGRTFRKKNGWYGPFADEALAKELAGVKENPMNPQKSIPVFEVKEKDVARMVDAAEKRVAQPSGTPDTPNPVPGGDPAEAEKAKAKAEARAKADAEVLAAQQAEEKAAAKAAAKARAKADSAKDKSS